MKSCAKAARVDLSRMSPLGILGKQMKDKMLGRFDKIQEPAPAKARKPLPIPDDRPKKKRGGKRLNIKFFLWIIELKRYRNMKDKFALSEIRKFQNRIKFGADVNIFRTIETIYLKFRVKRNTEILEKVLVC